MQSKRSSDIIYFIHHKINTHHKHFQNLSNVETTAHVPSGTTAENGFMCFSPYTWVCFTSTCHPSLDVSSCPAL